MRSVVLINGMSTSRLGFGTSRLHHLRTSGERQRLLAVAFELGFAQFDTAPAYGEGLAERELGTFLSGRSRKFRVVTKFGILPSWIVDRVPALGLPFLATRSLFRRAGFAQESLPLIDVVLLRRSVESSLRRLQTDHIDLLLLHEPSLQRIPNPDELTAALVELRQRGVIGGWGVAGRYEGLAPIIASWPALAQVVQTAESEWPDDAERRPDITYSAMSAGPQQFHNRHQPGDVALQRLENALRRRPTGAILVSSSKASHLKAVADLEAALPQ